MAQRKPMKTSDALTVPATLEGNPFFGLRLDDEQKALRDAIWSDDYDVIFVDAPAGSGKTTVAVGTSILLHHYGKFKNIVYVMHSVGDAQGFLPGDLTQKSSVWFEGLYGALVTCNEFPDKAIRNTSLTEEKNGNGYISAITDTYLRGSNLEGVIIIDEAQNYDEFALRKTLTRACEGTKVIVIGHTLQCDLPNSKKSGFKPCMDYFRKLNHPRAAFIELSTNHRSWVANAADKPWD